MRLPIARNGCVSREPGGPGFGGVVGGEGVARGAGSAAGGVAGGGATLAIGSLPENACAPGIAPEAATGSTVRARR